MRIETINGRHLLCGHIIKTDSIIPGQIWAPADGSDREVKVEAVKDGWVSYSWKEGEQLVTHKKMAFAFQCRYCLVIDKED